MMARRKAPEVIEELEDEVEELTIDEDEDDEVTSTSEVDGLTAKAVAKQFGTDGRTIRKFLRKKYGLVGQGKRWNITEDLDDLKNEFDAWAKGSRSDTKKKTKPPIDDVDEVAELDNEDLEAIEDIDELEDLDFGDDE
jgi:hypothetical protein